MRCVKRWLCGASRTVANREVAVRAVPVSRQNLREPKYGSLEYRALAMLLAWTNDSDEYGWHVNEWGDIRGKGGMTLDQFMSALQRLRRRGLVDCCQWHPGQGPEAEYLWFPVVREDA